MLSLKRCNLKFEIVYCILYLFNCGTLNECLRIDNEFNFNNKNLNSLKNDSINKLLFEDFDNNFDEKNLQVHTNNNKNIDGITLKKIVDNDNNVKRNHDKYNHYSPGVPLLLTPYIEQGKLKEGREKSKVQSFLKNKSIESYSGYVTVNKNYNSNIFFWYFVSENKPTCDPVVVWLQGGPGSSSLFGLFDENGPYKIKSANKLLYRKYTWSKITNLIYFDNPVGTGYSYTDNKLGYSKNQTQIGENLYKALEQVLKLFPNLQNNDLFLTGESYAGKYVPAFGYTIHKKNNLLQNNSKDNKSIKINLKGLMIGNGFTDPVNMLHYGNYLFHLGLIDANAKKEFNQIERQAAKYIKQKQWKKANNELNKLGKNNASLFHRYTGFNTFYNYYDDKSAEWEDYELKFITSNQTRKFIHVGNKTFSESEEVYNILAEDIPKSVIKWVIELLKHYRILFYNGQLDIICGYPLVTNFLSKMKWNLSKEFKKAKRHIYKIDDDVAGYYKCTGNLTEVLIRNAGHMVPSDQPKWALRLLYDFINGIHLKI